MCQHHHHYCHFHHCHHLLHDYHLSRRFQFSYRRFQLDEDTRIVSRCTVNGYLRKKSSDSDVFFTTVAFNEFDSKLTGDDWRQKLDSQRGYIVATQFRSNLCKATRWVAEAFLSGVDEVRRDGDGQWGWAQC